MINANNFNSLMQRVKAAQEEFNMAVIFHETWKPMVSSEDLLRRMGKSKATNTFNAIQVALRREMLLALMRVWDEHEKTIGIKVIQQELSSSDMVATLLARKSNVVDDRFPSGVDESVLTHALSAGVTEVLNIMAKYFKNGTHGKVSSTILRIRNEILAHRKAICKAEKIILVADEEVDEFYADTSRMIYLLMSLVLQVTYDPKDTAKIYKTYAEIFWDGVSGETTVGHPHFGRN